MSDKVKFEMTAVIPVYQYANLQPTVHTEADSFEEARDIALKQIQSIWGAVSEGGKKLQVSGVTSSPKSFVPKICDFTGAQVLMDEQSHTYQDAAGNKYLSGSTFATSFKGKFDARAISAKMATKHEVNQDHILSMWKTNAEASTSLGTAIHAGLELYGKYLQLSHKIKGSEESALHKNAIIKKIVQQFYEGRENETALYEAFAVDTDKHLCGFIDRLLIVDKEKKIVRVQDYKTNPDINKRETVVGPFKDVITSTSLGLYWLQLSFYAYIITKAGFTVEGLDIFNYDGTEWQTYQHPVIDISAAL